MVLAAALVSSWHHHSNHTVLICCPRLTVANGWTGRSSDRRTTTRRASKARIFEIYVPDDASAKEAVYGGLQHAWCGSGAMLTMHRIARVAACCVRLPCMRGILHLYVLYACMARPSDWTRQPAAWERLRKRLGASVCVRVRQWSFLIHSDVQLTCML